MFAIVSTNLILVRPPDGTRGALWIDDEVSRIHVIRFVLEPIARRWYDVQLARTDEMEPTTTLVKGMQCILVRLCGRVLKIKDFWALMDGCGGQLFPQTESVPPSVVQEFGAACRWLWPTAEDSAVPPPKGLRRVRHVTRTQTEWVTSEGKTVLVSATTSYNDAYHAIMDVFATHFCAYHQLWPLYGTRHVTSMDGTLSLVTMYGEGVGKPTLKKSEDVMGELEAHGIRPTHDGVRWGHASKLWRVVNFEGAQWTVRETDTDLDRCQSNCHGRIMKRE